MKGRAPSQRFQLPTAGHRKKLAPRPGKTRRREVVLHARRPVSCFNSSDLTGNPFSHGVFLDFTLPPAVLGSEFHARGVRLSGAGPPEHASPHPQLPLWMHVVSIGICCLSRHFYHNRHHLPRLFTKPQIVPEVSPPALHSSRFIAPGTSHGLWRARGWLTLLKPFTRRNRSCLAGNLLSLRDSDLVVD
jgi:hypothetical protein